MENLTYFIKAENIKWVKVGTSKGVDQLDKRVRAIMGREPFESFLYGVSSSVSESDAHKHLHQYRIRSEWFRWTKDVKSYATSVCDLFLSTKHGRDYWDEEIVFLNSGRYLSSSQLEAIEAVLYGDNGQ